MCAAEAAFILGGLSMRLTKVLCIMALVAMSAAVANAGSVLGDPTLTVKKPLAGTGVTSNALAIHSNALLPCPPGDNCFTNKVTNPLTPIMVNFSLLDSGTQVLFYQGNGTINSPNNGSNPRIWIEIVGIPLADQGTEIFNCVSNAFNSLGLGVCGGSNTVATSSRIEFSMFGGTLTPGEMFDATLTSTPEASTVLLFLSLIPVVFFATKRWNARQTA
jgi:hypothetical protein